MRPLATAASRGAPSSPPRGQHRQRGWPGRPPRRAQRSPRPASGSPATTPGPDPVRVRFRASGGTAPLLSLAIGAPYLRDNAKAGKLRRASRTHRAAMTAAGTARAHQACARLFSCLSRPIASPQPMPHRSSFDEQAMFTNNCRSGRWAGFEAWRGPRKRS